MKNLFAKRDKSTWIFLAAVFIFITAWAVIQPFNSSPDESMRYDIVKYLVNHGTLPDGRDPEIRNEMWGISYAFNPILAYMIMAIPAKIVSLFTSSSMALVIAARMVNVVFGTVMAYLVMRIGEMLFEGKVRWMFTCLVTFLPGVVFVHSYVNNDSMALLSSAWIVYAWVRSIREGWSLKICVHLALGISLCGLSYYNAYGFVLASMLFLASTILFAGNDKGRVKFLFARGGLIAAIVLALIGWWFIRNAILYDGDFLGWNISSQYKELYALEELKPSNRVTPQVSGMSIKDMMLWVPGEWQHNWLITVAVSFVGTFGFLDIFMPYWSSKMYFLAFGIGIVGMFLIIRPTFFMRSRRYEKTTMRLEDCTLIEKKIWKEKLWNKMSIFHWCMAIAMVIPFILLVIYAYTSDFQAQGRYILPMVIPFMYFVTCGWQAILERLIRQETLREKIYLALAALAVAGAVATYFGVFLPSYV